MVVDRPLREHQPLGDLAVAQPFSQQPQHFQLAWVRLAGLRLVEDAGPAAIREPRARAGAGQRSPLPAALRAAAARRGQAQRHLIVRIREREGGSYGQPLSRQSSAARADSPPSWRAYGSLMPGDRLLDAGAPAPEGQLAREPPPLLLDGALEDAVRRGQDRVAIAFEPRDLGLCRRHRPQTPEVPGRLRQGPRFLDRRSYPGPHVARGPARARRARRCEVVIELRRRRMTWSADSAASAQRPSSSSIPPDRQAVSNGRARAAPRC